MSSPVRRASWYSGSSGSSRALPKTATRERRRGRAHAAAPRSITASSRPPHARQAHGGAEAARQVPLAEGLGGRPLGDDPAARQEQRVRGRDGELLQVVAHLHGREARLARGERVQALEEGLAPGQVEPGGGLVEQQQARPGHQGAGQQHPLLLAPRQHGEAPVGQARRSPSSRAARAARSRSAAVSRSRRSAIEPVAPVSATSIAVAAGRNRAAMAASTWPIDARSARTSTAPSAWPSTRAGPRSGGPRPPRACHQRRLAGAVRADHRPALARPHDPVDALQQHRPLPAGAGRARRRRRPSRWRPSSR